MNRKLLALAVTAALAAPMAAQAAPTLYGRLNLSVDAVDLESTDEEEVQLNSNSSRIGVKGEEALGNGYSAIYKIEWEVAGDVAGTNDLSGRDRFVGLKGDWGTVKLGAYDSPLRTSQGAVDVFNDMTYTDMEVFISGENRLNNVIGYESPKIADVLTIQLAVQSGEDNGGAFPSDDDGQSLSLIFQSGGLYLAAAMDNDIADGTSFGILDSLVGPLPAGVEDLFARDAIRLTGVYTMDALQLGVMLQTSEFQRNDIFGDMDEESVLLSAAYTSGKNVYKGQLTMTTYDFGGGELEATTLALGLDHQMSQMTKVFVQAAFAQVELTGSDDADNTVVSVGMETRF